MEGIFGTVIVTARVWSTSRYREKILSLFCRVKNSDMGNGKSWKWAPRQIKIHRTKKEKSKGRKEESDPRKELDASRMTSRCKRIGMIRYSFLKQEGNNSIEKSIKNLFDHVHRKSLYKNYKNIREIFTVIVEKWNENSRSYDRRISSQQNRTSFIKMEHWLKSQLRKGWII